ncbi:MAG: hypothetical protein ABI640_13950 [Gammaproteobacteria bacterium]
MSGAVALRRTVAVFVALCAALALPAALAQPSTLVGDWLLTLKERRATHTGLLTIEKAGTGLVAFVDGGPASFAMHDGNLELTFDTRDGGGQLLRYALHGRAEGRALEGELTPPLNAPEGTWRAERYTVPPPAPPKPVDFTGVWSRTSSGLARVTLDYTPAAQAAVNAYNYLDDSALRCVSPGLVRISGWPYPLEIVQNDKQVTILYESFHEVRRIFLDGRPYPEQLPHRAMGYSLGHWEGSTLVVETKMLTPGYVDLAGQPLSANARVIERMSLSEDGKALRSELTLYDPENYKRPITRHRSWRREPSLTILEYDCDPYPFFRGLEIEGTLEEYWQRMRQRQ